MDIKETTLSYPSHDGVSQIYALVWEPQPASTQAPLRGIIQIIHGVAEHGGRYRDLARFLTDEGFVVCVNDHVGHGRSVSNPSQLGHMPGTAGKAILVSDVHALRLRMSQQYPDLPYIMLGHSMGSFILRVYLTHHAEGLTGAILSGTAQQPRALSAFGHALSRVLASTRGETYRSGFLDGMGLGAFAKTIQNARTPFDWICTDPAVVDAYIQDPACGFMLTVGGYTTLLDMTGQMVTLACAQAVPKDLPLLFICGSEDPVGNHSKAVQSAVNQYKKAGLTNVTLKVYPGLRHEILNEPTKQTVYQDILSWLNPPLNTA